MALLRVSRNRVGVRRRTALWFALALAVLAATSLLSDSALATSRSERNVPTLDHQVLVAVNRFRAAHGLSELHESPRLDRSARRHSLEMGRRGYFAHPSANGTSFWRRIEHYYPAKNYSYWSVGENLVWQSPSLSAAAAMRLWIASPPHLKNLLAPQWRQIGVSAVRVVRAPGVFGGSTAIIVSTDFGVRR